MSLMSPRKWPYLASLCSGYLHQDFTAVHGSAPKAAQAWLTEAGVADARELSAEWRRFLNVTSGMDVHAGNARLASWPVAHGPRAERPRIREGIRRC